MILIKITGNCTCELEIEYEEHCMSSTTMGVRLDEETRNRLKKDCAEIR